MRTLFQLTLVLVVLIGASSAQIIRDTFESRIQSRRQFGASQNQIIQTQRPRTGRQQQDASAVPGGVDFSGCVTDQETGLCCVDKESYKA